MNLDEYLDIKDVVNKFINLACGFDCKRKYRNRKFKKYHHNGIFDNMPTLFIPLAHTSIKLLRTMIEREKVSKIWNFFFVRYHI